MAKAKNTLAEARRLAKPHGLVVRVRFSSLMTNYYYVGCGVDDQSVDVIQIVYRRRGKAISMLCAALRSLRAGKGKSR